MSVIIPPARQLKLQSWSNLSGLMVLSSKWPAWSRKGRGIRLGTERTHFSYWPLGSDKGTPFEQIFRSAWPSLNRMSDGHQKAQQGPKSKTREQAKTELHVFSAWVKKFQIFVGPFRTKSARFSPLRSLSRFQKIQRKLKSKYRFIFSTKNNFVSY